MLMRRLFLLFLFFEVALHPGALGQVKPNVLMIAIDDLRPALGCYGDQIVITPNIDRLAKRGLVLQRAYCQQAVCCPSRLSMLTGLRPDTIRVWDLNTHFREAKPDAVTLPQHFKNIGYQSRSIGKILHGGGNPSKDPESWSAPPMHDNVRDPKLRYALPKNLKGKGLKRAASESAEVSDEHYIDGIVANDSIRVLGELAGNNKHPFFLAVGFRKPHLPFNAPKKYWDLYNQKKIQIPEHRSHPVNSPDWATRSWRELEGYTDIPGDGKITEAKVRELRHGYYACVSYIDALVGRLLAELERLKLDDNTIVILYGDHGFHLGEQGLWTKANNYELSTRVPLIVAAPGQPKGNSNAFVELVDVFPTVCELAGLAVPSGLEGQSFLPLFSEPNRKWKTAAFSQYPRSLKGNRHSSHGDVMGYAIRTERYRFVQWQNWKTKVVVARELYSLRDDPHEMKNIVNDADAKAMVARLAKRLAKGWKAALPK
jgi:iduronate 2-sulfatase